MTAKPVDTEKATQLAGGNAGLAHELYGLLQNELHQIAYILKHHDCVLEAPVLCAIAHKLRGSARFCAAERLERAAHAAETTAQSAGGSTQGLADACKELLAAVLELMALEDPYA